MTFTTTGLAVNNTTATATNDTTGDMVLRSTTTATNTTAPKGLYMRYDGTIETAKIESIDKTTTTLYPLNIVASNVSITDAAGGAVNFGIGTTNP